MDFKQYLREEERVDEILPLIGPLLAGAARVLPGVAKALPGAARTATTAIKPATQALQTATKVTKNVGMVTKPIKAGGGAVKKVGQELGTPAQQQQQTNSPEERLAASTHYITNRWVKLLGEDDDPRRSIPYVRTRGGKRLTDKQQKALHDKLKQSQLDQFNAMERRASERRTQSIRVALAKRERRHGGGDSSDGNEG